MSRLLLAALVMAGVTSAGCGSSPPSSFYALSPEAAAQPQRAPTQAMALRIKLRRPGIAGYLDRAEIVKKIVDHRLAVVDVDRWASPFDEMVERVLAEDIEQRLAGSSVITEDGAITAEADVTIEVDVRSFAAGAGGQVQLVAEVAMEKGDSHSPAGTRAVRLQQIPAGATTPALVATMSDLLGKLADEIVALVRTGEAPETSQR